MTLFLSNDFLRIHHLIFIENGQTVNPVKSPDSVVRHSEPSSEMERISAIQILGFRPQTPDFFTQEFDP